jgi:hypothetical protein
MREKSAVVMAVALLGANFWCAAETGTNKPIATTGEIISPAESFKQPKTLAELLEISPDLLEKVDIGRMNLLCAEGLRGSENLDVESCLSTLDAWARHVERETKRNFHHFAGNPKEFNNALPYYQMGMLGTVLAEDLRIQYNPEHERQLLAKPVNLQSVEEQNAFFSSSTDVFIHGLLTGKHVGTCASMPFLYAAIGRRFGYPVTIAARKYHLYVRYEAGNGEHMNMEATENRGFATPTDEEYRNGPYPMTQEEIDGCGWLRPLNNKEILGICLANRANCLRSMKRHDEEIKTLADAARYLPDTPLMKRVIEKGQQLARNLHAADRWDELWDELENLPLPTGGPMFERFQNRKIGVQFFMRQSTNLAEIEKSVAGLQSELRRYRIEISDSQAKLAEAFTPQQPSAYQQQFLALIQAEALPGRIRIPEERVPVQYWKGLPPELAARVQKLADEREIIEEMNVFAAEEIYLRNLEARRAMNQPKMQPQPLPLGQSPQAAIRPEDLPLPWRGRPVPDELQQRLADLNNVGGASGRQMRRRDEINKFFIDQDQDRRALEVVRQRRSLLDQLPVAHAPLQIEIVPSLPHGGDSPTPPNFPLTPLSERQINPISTGAGKP